MVISETINIALIDDHKLFREGVKRILSFESSFAVVADGDDGAGDTDGSSDGTVWWTKPWRTVLGHDYHFPWRMTGDVADAVEIVESDSNNDWRVVVDAAVDSVVRSLHLGFLFQSMSRTSMVPGRVNPVAPHTKHIHQAQLSAGDGDW